MLSQLLDDISSFSARPFPFLHSIYRLHDHPGLSILNYTQQLIGISELTGLVTNKSTFGIVYETGQALT
jgi:hypothetical protein